MDKRIMDFDLGKNLSTAEILRVAESRPYVSLLWVMSIITVLIFWYMRDVNPLSKVPLVTEKSFWDISGKKAKERFALNARGVVERGFKQVCMPHWKKHETLASRKADTGLYNNSGWRIEALPCHL
jgi:hypothetical protein